MTNVRADNPSSPTVCRRMSEFIKAPLGVQANRLVLLLYLALACLVLFGVGAFIAAEGIAFLAIIGLSSLGAIRLSWSRTRTARLGMALGVVFVPAVFATGVISSQMEASPKLIAAFFGYVLPIVIASLLFMRKKDNDYFTAKSLLPAAPDRPAPIPANQLQCLRIGTPTSEQESPPSPI